jgi:Leucine-rich repeat (LRR) protein
MTREGRYFIDECREKQSAKLDLTGCEIAYVSEIAELTHLGCLFIGDNKISDIAPLSALVNLSELYIGRNQISDIRPLSALSQLRVLQLQSNQIEDISPLLGLTNLLELDISRNKIKDISPLMPLLKLEYLTLEHNPLNLYPFVKVGKEHHNRAVLEFLRLDMPRKRFIISSAAQDFIQDGKLSTALKLVAAHFKAEDNKEVLLNILLLSQQLSEVNEKFKFGLVEVGYQTTEHARITKALLSVIWEACDQE